MLALRSLIDGSEQLEMDLIETARDAHGQPPELEDGATFQESVRESELQQVRRPYVQPAQFHSVRPSDVRRSFREIGWKGRRTDEFVVLDPCDHVDIRCGSRAQIQEDETRATDQRQIVTSASVEEDGPQALECLRRIDVALPPHSSILSSRIEKVYSSINS
ncbi:MAG: hypothetical protein ACKVXR_12135 [Planctomycetota bacterium]